MTDDPAAPDPQGEPERDVEFVEPGFGPPVSEFTPEPLPERWKNRIVRTEMVDPTQLLPYENNPKFHPIGQQRGMLSAFETLGQLQAVTVSERTGKLIDGHMRVGLAISEGTMILASFVDITEEEEAVAVATIDPLGNGAVINQDAYQALMNSLPQLDEALLAAIDANVSTAATAEPAPDPTDPGPGDSAKEPDVDMFAFGFIRWSTTRVDCTGEETQDLTRLYNEYLADNSGDDEGFLGWLIQPHADSTPTG